MRYFLDTEFIEDGKTIDLISIGIVCEDGRELYLENLDARLSRASPWVAENVLPHLDLVKHGVAHAEIGPKVVDFINRTSMLQPEFWGYYADYDWVAFCQLFGTMMDLPKHFPMFCMDLKQLAVTCGDPELPKQDSTEHHALADARWNRQVFDFLQRFKQ